MDKRGQFYLLAAIVIVGIIIGFSTVSNYSKQKSSIRIYDLGEELGIESGQVIEHGVYQQKNIDNLLENFTALYTEYAGEGKELYFVFGDEEEVSVATYSDVVEGEISVNIGDKKFGETITKQEYKKEDYSITGDEIEIDIGETKHKFKLKSGENFYYIISQDIEGEEYVVTN
ncbi:hypothetical protein CMI40_00805 [Candidatus Pacearchaeota archaeon]|jgi:hypothetical protein|nr:hypothetical protein [Candidatus Pacearchaeota archaeon]|tara:strand:- start:10591 stop:11109 length:519 start_codon:yes stop_codon:yes gene_type:complete